MSEDSVLHYGCIYARLICSHTARMSVHLQYQTQCACIYAGTMQDSWEWVLPHMHESRHTCEWVMSHVWMHHVAYMNEYKWVMSHMCRGYVTHLNESCHTYMNTGATAAASQDTCAVAAREWVMSLIFVSYVRNSSEWCHTYKYTGATASVKYRVAKTHRIPYFYVIFRKSDLYLVALLWKMICNLGDPMSLRHPATHACR